MRRFLRRLIFSEPVPEPIPAPVPEPATNSAEADPTAAVTRQLLSLTDAVIAGNEHTKELMGAVLGQMQSQHAALMSLTEKFLDTHRAGLAERFPLGRHGGRALSDPDDTFPAAKRSRPDNDDSDSDDSVRSCTF